MKQFHGKSSSIMINVPLNVKKEALKSLQLKHIGFKGATETGFKRAAQLSSKNKISIEDLRFIRNFFARHIYTSLPGFIQWEKAGRPESQPWHSKRSIMAILTWGGSVAIQWVNKYTLLLNKYFNTNYHKLSYL